MPPPKGALNNLSAPQGGPPPSYQQQTYQYVQPYPTQPLIIAPQQSARRRFFKAFAIALLLWFLFSAWLRSIIELAYWGHRHGRFYQENWPEGFPIPGEISTHRCVHRGGWEPAPEMADSFPYHSLVSFELPVSSRTLMVLARGSMSSGRIEVLPSNRVSENVEVDVVVSFFREDIRDYAKVCSIGREEGEVGVGIFTPKWWNYPSRPRDEQLRFTVYVHMPATVNGAPLRINNFETDLPLFAHSVGHLEGAVDFRNLKLRTSNMPVGVETMYADRATITTSNGPIAGSFNTSTSLSLITSNSPIKADIGMTNDNRVATSLALKTSNALIQAAVSLLRDNSQITEGKYNVSAATSNSMLSVNFPTSPVDSTLHLDAKTSNSPADVSLHPAYEGTFSLKSSIFTPRVERSFVEDPSGRGRRRSVEYSTYTRGVVVGTVKWAGSKKRDGVVDVKTSNSPVVLKL